MVAETQTIPSLLDVGTNDIVEWLQKVGMILLTDALNLSRVETPNQLIQLWLENQSGPALTSGNSASGANTAEQLPSTAEIRAFTFEVQAPSSFSEGTYKDALHTRIRTKQTFNRSEWMGVLAQYIKYKFGIRSYRRFPDFLWKELAELAWNEPTFAAASALAVETALRHRVLFKPGQFPVMSLSPNTFWLLIGLHFRQGNLLSRVNDTVRRRFARNSPPDLLGEVQQVLREKGSLLAIQNQHWAGLWDQWVLIETLNQQPQNQTESDFDQAVRSLSLYREKYPERTHISTLNIESDTWEHSMPQWFQQWYLSDNSSRGQEIQ